MDSCGNDGAADVIRMLARVATFTNDPRRQSAGAVIDQLQLALKGNVLYLDGGWQTIVDGLVRQRWRSRCDTNAGARGDVHQRSAAAERRRRHRPAAAGPERQRAVSRRRMADDCGWTRAATMAQPM